MPTTTAEQGMVQALIDAATKEERQHLRVEAEATLAEINVLMGQKLLSREESKASDIAIETLTRLDATEQNKGWWYRARRRVQLIQMYLGS